MHDSAQDGATPDGPASGYICPTCGGALWARSAGAGQHAFHCPIAPAFSAEQLWVEHCNQRNRALAAAARFLSENAALARDLSEVARALGNDTLAARLEQEATRERQNFAQI
jgi:two-component system chemotaxis response regulator CheB